MYWLKAVHCVVPKHGDWQKIMRRVEATEMDALRRSSRISRKERFRNVTIRQQIGLEKTIIKEIEYNQVTWYGHVQRMAEGRLPKIALKWIPRQRRAWGRPKKNWMESIRKTMNERNLNEGHGVQLSDNVEKRFETDIYIYIYIYISVGQSPIGL